MPNSDTLTSTDDWTAIADASSDIDSLYTDAAYRDEVADDPATLDEFDRAARQILEATARLRRA